MSTPPSASPSSADRPTPAARAIRRLGGTPDKIAVALKAELLPGEVEQLVQHLTGATAAGTA